MISKRVKQMGKPPAKAGSGLKGLDHNYADKNRWDESKSCIKIFFLLLLVLAFNVGCLLFEIQRYYLRPTLTQGSHFNMESIERTRFVMNDLTSLGPRITGLRGNEVAARDHVLAALRLIAAEAADDINIEIDVQNPSGSFHLEFLNGFSNVYCNVTNVVARLSKKSDDLPHRPDPGPHALLINAHFDSFIMSPGGSDDVVGVALMLEVLRLLSSRRSDYRKDRTDLLRNPIVFLFNGAEESNLQGSHGFITTHKWAKSVRALINLEAIGSGGRELMFQCNSPWMAQQYAHSVPYPHSSAVSHELFQKLLWRMAATDWRAIIQHGPPAMVGLDHAYTENGYAYHTAFDTSEIVDDGTILHTGSNLLQLASSISATEELSLPLEEWLVLNSMKLDDNGAVRNPFDADFIFFDVLGFVQITYSGSSILLLHGFTAMCAFYTCWNILPRRDLLLYIVKESFYSLLCSIAATATVGLFYSWAAPMRWYSGGSIYAVLIFMPPLLLAEFTLSEKRFTESVFRENAENARRISGLMFWSTMLFFTTLIGHKGSYLYMLWTAFGTIALLFRQSALGYVVRLVEVDAVDKPMPSSYAIAVEAVGGLFLVLPSLCWLSEVHGLIELLVPMFGKTGLGLSGDVTLGVAFGALYGFYLRYLIINPLNLPIFSEFMKRNRRQIRSSVVATILVTMIGIFCFLLIYGAPYDINRPKRLWIHLLDRDLTGRHEGRDSGLWVVGFDNLGLAPLSSGASSPRLDGRYQTSSLRGVWLSPDLHSTASESVKLISRPNINEHRKGFNCAVMNGECYLYWPYYFPVAEVLRDTFYLPTTQPEFSPTSGEEYDKIFKMKTESSDLVGNRRIVSVLLSGPSHLALVIKDNDYGKRILKWGFEQTTNGEAGIKWLMSRKIELSDAPPARIDGVHYIQIGFGTCTGACLFRMDIEIEKGDLIDISAYGHYVMMRTSEELQYLREELPKWARGAEWTFFVSKVIGTKI